MKSFSTWHFRALCGVRKCISIFAYLFLLVSQCSTAVHAQDLFPPSHGNFSASTTFAGNGWSTYNSAADNNKWYLGNSGSADFGARSAYISNNELDWQYSTSPIFFLAPVANVSHLYRLVTFDEGDPGYRLEFDWQCNGQIGWDYMLVSLAPEGLTGSDPVETNYTFINDIVDNNNDKLKHPNIHLARFFAQNSKSHAVIDIPQYLIGNCSSSITKKLVFTWVNNSTGGTQKPALVDNITLKKMPSISSTAGFSINHPADICSENPSGPTWTASPKPDFFQGTSGKFTISGSPSDAVIDFGNGTATLNMDKVLPGRNIIQYTFTGITGCSFSIRDTIEIYATPIAKLKETFLNCIEAESRIDLRNMFDTGATPGGVFTVTSTTNPGMSLPVDSIHTIAPSASGCYSVTYTLTNPNNCPGAILSDQKNLYISVKPKPQLGFDQPVFICQDGGTVDVTVTRLSNGDQPKFTYQGVTTPLPPGGYIATLDAPATQGANTYEFCLEEKNSLIGGCVSLLLVDDNPCSSTTCQRIVVYNDGNGCANNTPFVSECFPDFGLSDPCPIGTRPFFAVSCGFFFIPGFNIVEARLTPIDGLIFCDDEEVNLNYQGSLPGFLGDAVSGGPKLREIAGFASEAACAVIQFKIPLGPFGDIDPLPLGPLEEGCDQSIGQFVFEVLGDALGGDGGGGFVVADTDGDGAFDQVLADYFFPGGGTVTVPNNITTAKGTITVRNVTAFPIKPYSACGVVAPDGINLLTLLGLGNLPVVGAVVESALEQASCGVNLDFSDQETVEIPVLNTTPPVFANCNPAGYVFTEDLACSTEANWSVPVAYDGCNGGLLNYIGYTDGANPAFLPGAPGAVAITGSGVYQTEGPLPGSELPAGTYTVTYSAYSCGAIESSCTFPVVVSPGDPLLECPANATVRTDVDVCTAIVRGLTPLQGVGCATIIDYTVDYALGSGFSDINLNTPYALANLGTHHDMSGLPFPKGTTAVSYTMKVDINGDGDVGDANETQTCSFSVLVKDEQKPTALCQDIEVQLDNTGMVTVYAVDQGTGAPFVNGGSFDNCDATPTILIAKAGGTFASSIVLDCDDEGPNLVNLRIQDDDLNSSICIASIEVKDFFEGIKIEMDLPEICLESNNPVQLDFNNYTNITLPNGQSIRHDQVASNAYLGDAQGFYGISAFVPHTGSPSNDPGTITPDGIYTPGTGTGYVVVSYVMVLPGFTPPPNGNMALANCFTIAHATFELRQPLEMDSPECACVMENVRVVDLGVVSGGLEPYTIQYTDGVLDINGDGLPDDIDGEYTFDAINGHNINDFSEDLGELRITYNPFSNWSITIVDARGCEIFRSGSCDIDDLTESPTITCPVAPPTLFTEPLNCESQYAWQHPLPHDNCAVVLYNYQITNPDGTIEGPFTLDDLLNFAPGAPLPILFTAEYEFEKGVSTVLYYAEDAVGNFVTCSFQVTVEDDDPPYFINCPYPTVVENAETGHCDAYVNFALPLAEDNCDVPIVTQIDDTGLTTGDRFPVGTTVMYWEAIDLSGNKDTCQIKVIVNDYWQTPSLTCPADVLQDNDLWLCSAVVNNIAPTVDGPCEDNYAITYSIYADAALTQRKECGVWDASGEVFDVGDSWVKYSVQNQPLLLVTEVTQSTGLDQIEITNLGPAEIDLTCLEVVRTATNPAANEVIGPITNLPALTPTVLGVGQVMVFDFQFDGGAAMPACYSIAYVGTVIDEVAVNGFAGCGNFTGVLNSGDVIRICEDDSNDAMDWVAAENCAPLTIGTLNPGLDVMPDNGKMASLQSIPPNKVSCNFKVTIKDAEDPFCGKLDAITTYAGPGINPVSTNTCNRSSINIPDNGCIIGAITFNMAGTANPANATITLISPAGIKVPITDIPQDSIEQLFAQKAAGEWQLDIVPNIGVSVSVTNWSLTITCLDTFDLPDQVLPNDPGVCRADFTWTHPLFVDNCFEGTISVAYSSADAACTPTGGPLLGNQVKGGYSITEFFCVGTTLVTYTLTDAAGNVEMCHFSVTVNDVEPPVVTCPSTIYINLDGGQCGAYVSYAPLFAGDNCGVVDTVMSPPSGSYFEIGDHLVTITVFDAAGNSTTCTFTISVIEYVPSDFNLICNNLSNVSMDATCLYVLNADEALEGDNYHCYEDYIITVKNQQNQIVGNSFGPADIGKTFTVTVFDPESGNSCWSVLKIEDKLVPALTCPANLTVVCSESTEIAHTGNVDVQDCSAFTTVIDDEYTDLGQCNNPRGQIVRTWVVTDAWTNQSACTQTITITPFDLQNVVFPTDFALDCETAYLNTSALEPDATGRPSINGFPMGVGGLCTASVSYTDERFDICAGSYEILRTWKVRNTCFPVAPNNPISHVQVISVNDLSGPTFTCPPTVTVSTNPFQCCATAALPSMIVSEGCSGITDLEAKVTGVNPNNGNIITFTVGGTLADFPGNNWWNPDTLAVFDYTQCLPLGDYDVRYKASDNCGNTSYCNFTLTVADLVPPTVSCDQFTQVALINNGVAIVNASTFDDGATDNCCLDFFEVARMDGGACTGTSFGPDVQFCCSDINDTILVVFRAWDCHGNSNDCMVSVLVEDKIKPTCQAPAQVNVNCEAFDPSLWSYGIPDVSDNCCLDTNRVYQGQIGLTHSVNYALFDTVCNRGTITRTFRTFDCAGNSSQCTQRVIVTYEQDYFVKFPNDVIVNVCDGTGVYGEPLFFGEDCELLGVSFVDEIFTVVPDACFKIERTWKIINWCTFDPNQPFIQVPNPNPNATSNHPSNLPGPTVSACGTIAPWAPTSVRITPTGPVTNYCTFYNKDANGYEYKQIIKIIDGQAPTGTFVVPECSNQNWLTPNSNQLWNEMYWWDNGIQTHDLCEEPTDLCITATDACSGSNVNIEYLLFLDLDNDGVMETVVNSVNTGLAGLGWNNVLFGNANTPNFLGGTSRQFDERAVAANQKYGFSIQETVLGNNKTACVRWNTQQQQNNFVVPELPHGTHKIKWFITDGCGNNAEYEYTFTVKDCKAPTVVCLNGLSVNIMPTGMITLWASDFLQYTEDNCTPTDQIKIGIRKCGTGTGFPVDAQGNPITNVTFDCTELGDQCVELWAIDAAGNADFCETYVMVQDNLGGCQPSNFVQVMGALKTDSGQGVEEAIASINGTSNLTAPYSVMDLTDSLGVYSVFNQIPLEATFTIAPEKDDNPLNGVTTYDLVLISKHILGLEPLTSPYKMIAADANKSGSITTFDIVEIRKLILGIYTELPANTSWRFVDKSFQFPNLNNPFETAFPETISASNVSTHQVNQDFAGIKVGDVNGTAVANATMAAEDRTVGTAIFDIQDRAVVAGEEFEVTFRAAELLKGFQFTATLNGLKAIGTVDGDHVSASNFNLLPANAMAVSIDGAQAFTVRFRAEKAGKLSQMLGVSGAITRAEAYPASELNPSTPSTLLNKKDVAFRFDGKTIAGVGFELYQNQPNPFAHKTSIGFFLPEAAEATLSIMDEAGRLVYQQKGQFAKGHNAILLERALVSTTGVLYYQLETATDRATKKMIQAK